MFYVFGVNGPMYQGGPERLSHITAVRGVPRPAALRPGASGVEGREAQTRTPPQAARNQGAVAAYRSTEEGPKQERQPLELVRDVMTRGALTVNPRDTVQQAWALLSQHHIAQAPVLGDDQRVVGLLLRADIAPLDLLPTEGERRKSHALAAQRPVSEWMVSPVPAVAEDTPLRRVATVLLETGLPGLPVTTPEGDLSGFISRTDILRAVAADPPLDLWG